MADIATTCTTRGRGRRPVGKELDGKDMPSQFHQPTCCWNLQHFSSELGSLSRICPPESALLKVTYTVDMCILFSFRLWEFLVVFHFFRRMCAFVLDTCLINFQKRVELRDLETRFKIRLDLRWRIMKVVWLQYFWLLLAFEGCGRVTIVCQRHY